MYLFCPLVWVSNWSSTSFKNKYLLLIVSRFYNWIKLFFFFNYPLFMYIFFYLYFLFIYHSSIRLLLPIRSVFSGGGGVGALDTPPPIQSEFQFLCELLRGEKWGIGLKLAKIISIFLGVGGGRRRFGFSPLSLLRSFSMHSCACSLLILGKNKWFNSYRGFSRDISSPV